MSRGNLVCKGFQSEAGFAGGAGAYMMMMMIHRDNDDGRENERIE